MGRGYEGGGEREIIYLSLHCHHQNDFCIKMGSDESHFNGSVGSDGHSKADGRVKLYSTCKKEPHLIRISRWLFIISFSPFHIEILAARFPVSSSDTDIL